MRILPCGRTAWRGTKRNGWTKRDEKEDQHTHLRTRLASSGCPLVSVNRGSSVRSSESLLLFDTFSLLLSLSFPFPFVPPLRSGATTKDAARTAEIHRDTLENSASKTSTPELRFERVPARVFRTRRTHVIPRHTQHAQWAQKILTQVTYASIYQSGNDTKRYLNKYTGYTVADVITEYNALHRFTTDPSRNVVTRWRSPNNDSCRKMTRLERRCAARAAATCLEKQLAPGSGVTFVQLY